MSKANLPAARWRLAKIDANEIENIVKKFGVSPLLATVISNRGLTTWEKIKSYLEPESDSLPNPRTEFPDLNKSVILLQQAIAQGQRIAICGDYDADGMTSTALLLRALRYLKAEVDYEIPQRLTDGYGINERIVEKLATNGVGLILTVDNGISAYQPIAKAVNLGIKVIITDHHELPATLPPADAILNPKLIPPTSCYSGLAGVGVAYILAMSLVLDNSSARELQKDLLALYTLGTIADLAPLTGVNRRWLKRGLALLPQSQVIGVQALMQVAGVNEGQTRLKPEDIGFKLGPRINAIGRIDNPQVVIDLLTTADMEIALNLAQICEQTNHKRQQMCQDIEIQAIAMVENTPIPWLRDRVMLLMSPDWHHGVIGIVASRLVERYGVPVFIATYEDNPEIIRGSARGIEEFSVIEALEYSKEYLIKYGGHKAAGGFSLYRENLLQFHRQLSGFAHQCLQPQHLQPLIKIDAMANLDQLHQRLYQEIDRLHPWGIGNDFPVFWTPQVQILKQRIVGNKHLKLTIAKEDVSLEAIAWRWREYFPLPPCLDIAYKLRENYWQGETSIELELVSVRLPKATKKAQFQKGDRTYWCSFWADVNEIRIKNPTSGKVLVVKPGSNSGILGVSRDKASRVDVTDSPYSEVVALAYRALCYHEDAQ